MSNKRPPIAYQETKRASIRLRKLLYVSVAGSMAYVLARFTKFPLFAAAPFLKMDFGEVPLLLIASLCSPEIGLAALGLKEMLSLFISGSNMLGLIADFFVAGTFLLLHSKLLGRHSRLTRVLLCCLVGTVARLIIAVPVNLIILKLQYGTPAAGVFAQMAYILPFNAIKSILGSISFALLFRRLRPLFPATRLTYHVESST